MKVLYFAWVRERIGKTEEALEPPATVTTVGELMDWLAGRGAEYAHAFENRTLIRAAVNHAHVRPETTLQGAQEIAFFPPMTGG